MTFCIKLLFSSSRLVQLIEGERGRGREGGREGEREGGREGERGRGREREGETEGGREGEGGRKVTGLVVNAALITW